MTYDAYGNLAKQDEYTQANTLFRSTEHCYATLDTASSYIVDRPWADDTRDGAGQLRTLTQYFYDGLNTSPSALGSKGDLTRVANYYDVPLVANAQNITLHGQDTSSTYDAYGNRTTETTYAQAGTRLYTGSAWTISAPGNSSAARTSTTGYDTVFHAFPTSFSNALTQGETAGYDYRMGTLTSVTDANNATTTASYDVFGRMVALAKPGDSTTYPTVQAYYGDSERPFRYQVAQREQAGTGNVRYSQSFYDGLGRQIQQKREGAGVWQNIVTDTRYDGLNRAPQQSQPHPSNEDSFTFWRYTNPGPNLFNPTSTSYDALSRPLVLTAPDSTTTTHLYGLDQDGGGTLYRMYDNVTDANGHQIRARADVYGRRYQVLEYNGASTATTTYLYSPLDLLTSVSDANGNTTSIGYSNPIGFVTWERIFSRGLRPQTPARADARSQPM